PPAGRQGFYWKAVAPWSEPISILGQTVGEVVRHLLRLILVEPVIGHQFGQEIAVDAPRHVVARGDRAEGAGVVVEADRVVEAGRLRGKLAKAVHAFGAVEKPPGRPKPQGRIMPGKRR